MSRLTLIVAATKTNGIGQNAKLPWRLPQEMSFFARATSNAPEGERNSVIMGRNTWESIPKKFRPLPNRFNVVITRQIEYSINESDSVKRASSLSSALTELKSSGSRTPTHRNFIIGGAHIYSEALAIPPSPSVPYVDRVLLTRILHPDFEECDVFMPNFLNGESNVSWSRSAHSELEAWVGFEVPEGVQEERGVQYEFQMWVR